MTDIWHSVKIPGASGLEIWVFDITCSCPEKNKN